MALRCRRKVAVAAVASGFALTGGAPVRHESNVVQVAARVATFLQPGLSGQVTAAIIYQPGDPGSDNEARQIERAIGTGITVGALKLRPRRVAAGADLAGAKVAFVTKGVNYRAAGMATAARSILSFGSDPSCMKEGYCTVTIASNPTVQITVSKVALKAANLRFSAGFLMLIREI